MFDAVGGCFESLSNHLGLSVIEALEMSESVGEIFDVGGGHFESLNDHLSYFFSVPPCEILFSSLRLRASVVKRKH